MNITSLINNAKKVIFGVCLGVALLSSYDAKAASATVVVQANSMTNLLTTFQGSAFVTGFTISAPTNIATVYVYDTITNQTTWTNAQYTNIQLVASNNVITWTNYYGVTNNITNVSLMHITNTIVASTNNWPLRIIATANAAIAPTVTYTPNLFFLDGIWVTNVTTNSATLNITYRQ